MMPHVTPRHTLQGPALIVAVLTLACTVMALVDLLLLSSGVH
jgi:hypothetical protein